MHRSMLLVPQLLLLGYQRAGKLFQLPHYYRPQHSRSFARQQLLTASSARTTVLPWVSLRLATGALKGSKSSHTSSQSQGPWPLTPSMDVKAAQHRTSQQLLQRQLQQLIV